LKITNHDNLPRTILNAIERDDYTRGNARISITGLLKPPRIGLLYSKHAPDIEKDVTDFVWALFGKAVHKILEMGGDEEHIPEERLFAEVRGWRVSGQLDLQKLSPPMVAVTDYKVTTAWAVMHEKTEWVEQLNAYRWLLEQATNYRVSKLAICAFVRDWSRHQAGASNSYPQKPMVMIDIPLWSTDEAAKFIDSRVRVHQGAQALWDMGEEPPHCTDEERWMRTASYAVRKQGNKRATKTFDNALDATNHAKALGAEFVVDTRKGEPIRCTGDYCSVSRWCSQYREWREKNG
jgi:hypothetical protein